MLKKNLTPPRTPPSSAEAEVDEYLLQIARQLMAQRPWESTDLSAQRTPCAQDSDLARCEPGTIEFMGLTHQAKSSFFTSDSCPRWAKYLVQQALGQHITDMMLASIGMHCDCHDSLELFETSLSVRIEPALWAHEDTEVKVKFAVLDDSGQTCLKKIDFRLARVAYPLLQHLIMELAQSEGDLFSTANRRLTRSGTLANRSAASNVVYRGASAGRGSPLGELNIHSMNDLFVAATTSLPEHCSAASFEARRQTTAQNALWSLAYHASKQHEGLLSIVVNESWPEPAPSRQAH